MVKIVIDPESLSLANHFALVRSPRRNRKRFAESCVMVTPDEDTALEQANADKNLHPAVVYGPFFREPENLLSRQVVIKNT